MPSYEFKLPDIGEGVAEGEIIRWLVSEGDIVKEDQPLVEVMTDKVNVEIPSPKAGRIARIFTKVGEVVKVGANLVVLEIGGETRNEKPSSDASKERAVDESFSAQTIVQKRSESSLAAPATRKLAAELGVDLAKISGTGPGGRITSEDVKNESQKVATIATTKPEGERQEERVPLRGLRKIIAERMVRSAHSAAQVTHVDECDVTELIVLKNRLASRSDESGINAKMTFLPLIIKSLIPALKEYPFLNALFDDKMQEIVLKRSYNIGIATDTEQGLIVPVIKEADKKDLFELASEIESVVASGRSGKLSLDDVRGSTFTITNVGSVGGLYSTPLVNYPEVAILGIQKIVKRPIVKDDAVVIRDVMNFSLSFDHRVIDGAYAARFLNRVIREIENPSGLVSG